ncbi:MAG: RNA 2',3'-cyclic phosphodiesterase [Chloroflexi bacterium]|nr:RNA 2',3'-cyclic phosphodiesterase [Chloroflexota bacterium]
MTEKEEQWRLFWAIPLPKPIHTQIEHLQKELIRQVPGGSVRWVPANNVHVTLAFLGDWYRSRIPPMVEEVTQALEGIPPFDVEIAAAGVFPNYRRPRVIWLGIGGDVDALHRVQAAVARALVMHGWKPERRGYSPHLTIGRVRRGQGNTTLAAIGQAVQRLKVDPFGRHQVREITLYRSVLKPSGAEYTPVARVTLQ